MSARLLDPLRKCRVCAIAAAVVSLTVTSSVALALPASAAAGHHPAAASRTHHVRSGRSVSLRGKLKVRHRSVPRGHRAFDPAITVSVAGTRDAAGNPVPLSGVEYQAVGANGNSAECTTGASGTCTINVTSTASQTYTVRLISVPGSWFSNPGLGVYASTAVPANNPATDYAVFTGVGPLGPDDAVTLPADGPDSSPPGSAATTARGSQVAFSRHDPREPTQCGLKVAMLFDLSSSITPALLPGYLNAGQQFVTALEGTPSQVGVYTFGTEAPAGTGANNAAFGPQSVTRAADADAVRAHIGNLTVPAASFTNWDSGLRQITEANQHYDVVIVLTDGDPTRWGRPATPNPAPAGTVRTRFIDVENGIFSANQLKGQTGTSVPHTAVLAVGVNVPSPGSQANLRSISGDGDYYSENWNTLGPALRLLALKQCEGTITVVKHVVPYGGTVSEARPGGAGWRFTSQTPSETRETDEINSAVNFRTTGVVTTTITDHGRPGYRFLSADSRCQFVGSNTPVVFGRRDDGVRVTPDPDRAISCDVFNEEPRAREELTVTKHASPGTFTHAGQVITYYYRVTNTGNVTMDDIGVDDDRIPGTITSCEHRTLAPDEHTICTARYTITPRDMAAGHVLNFARVTGEDPGGHGISSRSAEAKDNEGRPEVPVTG